MKAAQALENFLLSLEGGDEKVTASAWLATSLSASPSSSSTGSLGSGFDVVGSGASGEEKKKKGERLGREVVASLRDNGAKIIRGAAGGKTEMHWLENEEGEEIKKEI